MTLRQYLVTDPDKLGISILAEKGSDGDIAFMLNDKHISRGVFVKRQDFETILIGQGISGAAAWAISRPDTPMELFIACTAMRDMLRSNEFPELQLDNPATIFQQEICLKAGIMQQGHIDALFSRAYTQKISFADREGFGIVTAEQIGITLRGKPEANTPEVSDVKGE